MATRVFLGDTIGVVGVGVWMAGGGVSGEYTDQTTAQSISQLCISYRRKYIVWTGYQRRHKYINTDIVN